MKEQIENAFERLHSFITSHRPDVKGQEFLSGNFAPVFEEMSPQEAKVIVGEIPKDLNGVYMRNGPNPAKHVSGSYHWFDGDGMIHATEINGNDGKITYSNSFVKTDSYVEEKQGFLFGDMHGMIGFVLLLIQMVKTFLFRILGIHKSMRNGKANTSLIEYETKVFALHEGDLPYEVSIKDGEIETVGYLKELEGKVKTFTAHPKLDPDTGDLHFISYNVFEPPYLRYGVLNKEYKLNKLIPIEIPYSAMIHDFSITENHIVFILHPLVFSGANMLKNKLPFTLDKSKMTRIGILSKKACYDVVTWYKLPAFGTFHVINSYEQEGKIHLYLCQYTDLEMELNATKRCLPEIYKHVIDTETGLIESKCLMPGLFGEFPVINPKYVGKPNRFAWVGVMDETSVLPKFCGLAKIDLTENNEDIYVAFEEECYGGEFSFVGTGANEDDGYMIGYVHDEINDMSFIHIYDAKTLNVVMIAEIPQRVPYGFHGAYISSVVIV
jgi:carotenoid cleavage dioxygenase-like enzyme